MNTKNELPGVPANWFVGASYGGTDDQLPRFLSEGIWENGYDDKHLDVVRSMRTGDRIAIKASYTRANMVCLVCGYCRFCGRRRKPFKVDAADRQMDARLLNRGWKF